MDDRIFLWELGGEKRRWVLFDPKLLKDQTKLIASREERHVGQTLCTCDTICTCNTVGGGEKLAEGRCAPAT